MLDTFAENGEGLNSPARSSFPITPSNTVDLATCPRQVRFDQPGAVSFFLIDDNTAGTPIVINVSAGEYVSWRFRRVMATGTTVAAGSITGVY